jgi:hypothetical protein
MKEELKANYIAHPVEAVNLLRKQLYGQILDWANSHNMYSDDHSYQLDKPIDYDGSNLKIGKFMVERDKLCGSDYPIIRIGLVDKRGSVRDEIYPYQLSAESMAIFFEKLIITQGLKLWGKTF